MKAAGTDCQVYRRPKPADARWAPKFMLGTLPALHSLAAWIAELLDVQRPCQGHGLELECGGKGMFCYHFGLPFQIKNFPSLQTMVASTWQTSFPSSNSRHRPLGPS